jgi:hypothetical protein
MPTGYADSASELTQAGFSRMRTFRSCNTCRTSKSKCTGEPVCTRCAQKGLECVYEGKKEPGWMANSRAGGALGGGSSQASSATPEGAFAATPASSVDAWADTAAYPPLPYDESGGGGGYDAGGGYDWSDGFQDESLGDLSWYLPPAPPGDSSTY